MRGAQVLVDGKAAWQGRSVTSPVVWSPQGDALAFAGKDRAGRATLVVVLVPSRSEPQALSWPIPRSAEPARAVTWLGQNRLGAGPSELAPRVVATFSYSEAIETAE